MEHPKSLFTARLGVLIAGNRSNFLASGPSATIGSTLTKTEKAASASKSRTTASR